MIFESVDLTCVPRPDLKTSTEVQKNKRSSKVGKKTRNHLLSFHLIPPKPSSHSHFFLSDLQLGDEHVAAKLLLRRRAADPAIAWRTGPGEATWVGLVGLDI